jgi:hypothetical protein
VVRLNWVRRVVTWDLTGTTPATHRLTWSVDEAARTSLEQEIFGKRILITDRGPSQHLANGTR